MMAIPRAKDMTRKADVFDILLIDPVERLTHMLRRGDAISDDAEAAICKMIARGDALKAAYEHRVSVVES